MSVFERIKKAIFGDKPAKSAATQKPAAPTERATTAKPAPGTGGIPASPADAAWERREPIDVEAVLIDRAAKNPQKLNWRTSIVDLMKLLDIDSSLAHRTELAQELGYTGDTTDSAAMNVWLHKRVMQELERNGGKVPASLIA